MKMISHLPLLALAICVLLALPSCARAQTPQAGEVQEIEVRGCGTILGGDTARARDGAIIDARKRALEKASGVYVDAETVVKNGALFDAIVRTQVPGFIKADRILTEGREDAGLYCVTIKAWVIPQELKERLADLVSEVSIVVQVSERNCVRPQVPPIVENHVISKLVKAGYKVLDVSQLKENHRRDLERALLSGDPDAAKRLQFQFLLNLLVGGRAIADFSQDNQGMISARAQLEVRVVVAETAQILWNAEPGDVLGFGSGCEIAGRRALQNGGKSIGDPMLEALDQYVHRKDREIELRVRGLADSTAYRRIKMLVQGERWVTDVRDGQFSQSESTLFIRYPEKTIYLATSLAGKPEAWLRLVEFGWTRIVLDVLK